MKIFLSCLFILIVVETINGLTCRQKCQGKPRPALCRERCKADERSSFIVGGSDVIPVGQYPWQGSLRYSNNHICGVSVIGPQHILTAAHCFNSSDTPSDYSVVLGLHDLADPTIGDPETFSVDTIIKHGSYAVLTQKQDRYNHDLAIIRLSTPIDWNSNYYIYMVDLAPNDGTVYVGRECYISGWGKTSTSSQLSDTLQSAQVDLIDNTECETSWGNKIDDGDICASGQATGASPCDGDAGGPLVCKDPAKDWILVGVTSWGNRRCRTSKPYVYMRVSYYNQWIQDNMV